MKSFIFKCICLVCFLMIGLSAYPSGMKDLKTWGLKGSVKAYKERVYKAEKVRGKWQEGDIEEYGYSVVTFDENGNFTLHEIFKTNGSSSVKYIATKEDGRTVEDAYLTYFNDTERQLIHRLTVYYLTDDSLRLEWHNAKGEKIREGMQYRKGYKNTKTVIKQIANSIETGETTTITFEYDENDNVKEEKQINEKGEIVLYKAYKYLEFDKENNWTKRLIYGKGGKPKSIAIRQIGYY